MTKVDLDKLAPELELSVTTSMREAKAAFWAVAVDTPMVDPAEITLSAIQQIVPDTRIKHWWSLPGFQEWFCNKEEWRQRVEYLVNVGLDTIEQVLLDPEAAPSARVKAFEVLARMANKEPARVKEVKFADATIQELDTIDKLRAFIERSGYAARIDESSSSDEETPGETE